MSAEQECFTKLFDGCTCAPGACQSFAAEQARKLASRKSQRDAEATVRAKAAAYRAMLVVLAVASICAFLGTTAHTLIKTDKQIELARRV